MDRCSMRVSADGRGIQAHTVGGVQRTCRIEEIVPLLFGYG
jgi:hypothetical protein